MRRDNAGERGERVPRRIYLAAIVAASLLAVICARQKAGDVPPPCVERPGEVLAVQDSTLPPASAQEAQDSVDSYLAERTVTKEFLILKSTRDYDEALAGAREASKRLNLKLDLRGLAPHKETGLTFSREECAKDPLYPYPSHLPRGRFDDGEYVSVEFSSGYQGFAEGYYLVMAASGETVPAALRAAATRAFPGTCVKQASVYMGCMH